MILNILVFTAWMWKALFENFELIRVEFWHDVRGKGFPLIDLYYNTWYVLLRWIRIYGLMVRYDEFELDGAVEVLPSESRFDSVSWDYEL